MKNRKKSILASIVLACSLVIGCVVPSWVVEAENIVSISLPIVTSVVSLVDPVAAPIATAAAAGLAALLKQFQAYQSNPSADALAQINAQLVTLNSQLAQVEQTANIADPATKQKVQAILTLIIQEMEAVQQIVAANAKASAVPGAAVPKLDHKHFQKQYQKLVKGDSRFPQF